MTGTKIGIIDSGVGGLHIFSSITATYPSLPVVYLADSKYVPYGTKSPEFITKRAEELVHFLLEQGIELIVIACNTITVTCLDTLREKFPNITFIGTVPVIKTAAEKTKNHRIGILSTIRTAESEYVDRLVKEFASDCIVTSLGTDALVPLVERGEVEGERVKAFLENVLSPFITADCDTIVLGCTHFPFLEPAMQEVLGNDVLLLDSSVAIVRQVGLLTSTYMPSQDDTIFYTTGELDAFIDVVKKLLTTNMSPLSFLQARV